MKSLLMVAAVLLSALFSSIGSADITDTASFMGQLRDGGSWTGKGTTEIASGKFAGRYSINVTLTVTQNSDTSWTVTNKIVGVPPQTTTSQATYELVTGDDQALYLLVTSGQYSNYADINSIDSAGMDFSVSHVDKVTGATVTNVRTMTLDANGKLAVAIDNLQNGSSFQTYNYKLSPAN